MAGAGLSGPGPDAATSGVVEAYLADLAAALAPGPARQRAAIVAELRDGLHEAIAAGTTGGSTPRAAAATAIAGFGDPLTVAAGFTSELAAASARRVGRGLLLTGPLVGLTWLGTLALRGLAAARPLPGLGGAAALFAVVLAVAVPAAIVAVAVTGRLSRWLPSGPRVATAAAAVAAAACAAGDAALLLGLAVWVTGAAAPAWWVIPAGVSLTRLVLAVRAARRCLAVRATLA
jgi:hypothetical protein